ncbi:conserved hypothetical protein [delta proteobacterium NaphS2]|nr:conserved hypothetical protein [delta proteobacterium NaphS2]
MIRLQKYMEWIMYLWAKISVAEQSQLLTPPPKLIILMEPGA